MCGDTGLAPLTSAKFLQHRGSNLLNYSDSSGIRLPPSSPLCLRKTEWVPEIFLGLDGSI